MARKLATKASAPDASKRSSTLGTDLSLLDEAALLAIPDRSHGWATYIVHYANDIRDKTDTLKVGGHQASSASVVSIMTALFFDFLAFDDFVSIKPHASAVLHAIAYLLGHLEASDLTSLRAFHGLQVYPSRSKDPDRVDFSTGSVASDPLLQT
jgi:pyruvate dehydrogenase E1 component